MKKLLLFITAIFICGVSIAQTIRWHIGTEIIQTNCNAGESITPPTVPEKFGYSFVKWKLPYTPIEYLESTGTQYIDTGVKCSSNLKIEIVFMYPNSSGNVTNSHVFGARDSGSGGSGYAIGVINNKFIFDYNERVFTNIQPEKQTIYKIIKNKNNNQIIVGDDVISISNNTEHIFSSNYSNRLFVINDRNYNTQSEPEKIYYCKIWDSNNVLLRDFIPVLDKNGTPCMYDKIENKFYYNAGTGQFIAGPVIGE